MSTASYGQPSIIDQAPMPPAAVNISSSTNASPTVITTSSAHGLQTGQAVIVNGHATNTNANGIWIATVVSSTTFKISTFAGFATPTYIAGNGVGGATGTVQSLAFPGVNLPQDATDDRDASSVNVPFEFSIDALAWLAYRLLAKVEILAGGTLTANSGSVTTINGTFGATSTTFLNGTTTINGAVTATSTATLSGTAVLSGLTRYRDQVYLTDANHTVSTASADVYQLAQTNATTRTIKLQTTTAPVPLQGERLLVVGYKNDGLGPPAGSLNYNIQREDGTQLAAYYGGGAWALFQFDGTVWKGVCHSGGDPANPIPGAVVTGTGWT